MSEQLKTVNAKGLAAVLGVTDRWVRDLEKQGVFKRQARGRYDLTECVPAYVEWRVKAEVTKQAPPSGDRVRDARAAEIERRMAREDRKIIDIDEAFGVLDDVVGHFLQSISGLPAQITRNVSERRRIEAICDAERQRLATRFAEGLSALQTGDQAPDADDEDDA